MNRTLTAALAAGLIALSLAGCSHPIPKDVSFEQRVANCKIDAKKRPKVLKANTAYPIPARMCERVVAQNPSYYPVP